MSVTGEGAGREPVKVGAPVTDITAGILAAFGITAALFERERTGKGQLVDTSLLEAGITHTFWQSAISLASGVPPPPVQEADENRLAEALGRFSETLVREVMTPRADVASIAGSASISDLRQLMRDTKYSRIPVYGENLDDIQGLVDTRVLLARLLELRVDVGRDHRIVVVEDLGAAVEVVAARLHHHVQHHAGNLRLDVVRGGLESDLLEGIDGEVQQSAVPGHRIVDRAAVDLVLVL